MNADHDEKDTIDLSSLLPVELSAISHYYERSTDENVLHQVTLSVQEGEYLAIMGPSGSGKSTLLKIMGTLLRPSSGRVELFGQAVYDLDDTRLSALRSTYIGFLFQAHHLLPEFTVGENVILQMMAAGCGSPASCLEKATAILERVGLRKKIDKLPRQLSMGERQRSALSRAVAHGPGLLLCDEPTGSLDSEKGSLVLGLIYELRQETLQAVVVATHNPTVAGRADRVLHLVDGTVNTP